MDVVRKRPLKMFVVLQAHGPYRVGDKIQPTGMYRDVLVKRGLIKEITDEPVVEPARMAQGQTNRMVPPPSSGDFALSHRAKKAR